MKYYTLTSDSTITITINDHDYTYTYADLDPTRDVPYRFNIGAAAVDSSVPINVYIYTYSRWDSEGHSAAGVISVYNTNGNLITTTGRHGLTKDYRGVATLREAINLQCLDDPPTTSGAIGVPGHTTLSECPKSIVLTDSRLSGGCGIELTKEYESTKVVNYEDIKVKVIFHGQGVVPDYSTLYTQGAQAHYTPSNIPSNYTFKNWSQDPNATAGLGSYPVTEFTDLYAIWALNESNQKAVFAKDNNGSTLPNFYVNFSIQPEWKKYITVDRSMASQNLWVWRIGGLPANCTYTARSSQGTVTFKTYDGRTIMTVSNPSVGGYTYNNSITVEDSQTSYVYHMTKNVTKYSVRFETVDLDGNALNGVIWYNNNSRYSASTFSNGVTVSGIPETYRYKYSQDSSTDVDHIFKIVNASGSQIGSNKMDAQILEQYRNSYEFVRYEQSSLGSGNIRIRMVLTEKGSGGSGGWPSPGTQMWYQFRIRYKYFIPPIGYTWRADKNKSNYLMRGGKSGDITSLALQAIFETVTTSTNITDPTDWVLKFVYLAYYKPTDGSTSSFYPNVALAYLGNKSVTTGLLALDTDYNAANNGISVNIHAKEINAALVNAGKNFQDMVTGSGTENDPYMIYLYITMNYSSNS